MSQQLDIANQEFEQILAVLSQAMGGRIRNSFQISTIQSGRSFPGAQPYFAPGSFPNQTGPSAATAGIEPFSLNLGDSAPITMQLMMLNGLAPATSPTANPGSMPPVGPEESLRYSCTDGQCVQDPNGIYYGIEECADLGCAIGSGTDPDGTVTGGGGGNGPDKPPQLTQTFKGAITGISCVATGLTSGSKTYWTYTWLEVVSVGVPRSSTDYGDALNEFELSVADSGGNTVPATATITRNRIPDGTILDMFLDENNEPWFYSPCPLEVACT